ncbi:MAG: hypothetical protein WA239_06255 [Candidatus Sulfotelmatobacter sp.]|jgi:hypothetical protein
MNQNNNANLAPEASVLTVVPAETEARVFEAEAAKLADSAILTNAKATTAAQTEEDLYAEIARLWTANNVNRYELGEKLWQLKQQAKHGEWMTKVEAMGIPHRTVTSLISYYRDELAQRNAPPITDADFDSPDSVGSEDEHEDEPQPERKKAPYFRPMIALNWGDEEKAWTNAIEVIITQVDHVNNPTEAALFAVVEVAKQFKRQQREIDAIGVGSPSVVSKVEPPETASSVALVAVAPPPGPEDESEAVPVPSSDVPHSPRRRLVFTEDEEVQ